MHLPQIGCLGRRAGNDACTFDYKQPLQILSATGMFDESGVGERFSMQPKFCGQPHTTSGFSSLNFDRMGAQSWRLLTTRSARDICALLTSAVVWRLEAVVSGGYEGKPTEHRGSA